MQSPFPGGASGPILIVGAGYYGEDVLDALRALEGPEVRGVLRTGEENKPVGDHLSGVPVIDTVENIALFRSEVVAAVIAAPAGRLRERVAALLHRAEIPLMGVVHPNATVSTSAVLAAGAVVLAAAVIGAGARLGVSSWIGSGAIIGSQCRVGDFSQVASTAALGNGARIGQRAYVGMGSTVLDDVLVGADVEIAAGAIVTSDAIRGEMRSQEKDPV